MLCALPVTAKRGWGRVEVSLLLSQKKLTAYTAYNLHMMTLCGVQGHHSGSRVAVLKELLGHRHFVVGPNQLAAASRVATSSSGRRWLSRRSPWMTVTIVERCL